MREDIETLASELDEAVALLNKHGLAYWANWLLQDTALIRKGDFYGIEHLLSAYGGMGSINDLVLPERKDDARFSSLLTSIYTQARALQREQA